MKEKLSVVRRNQHDTLMAARTNLKAQQSQEKLAKREEQNARDAEPAKKTIQEMLEKFSQYYYGKSLDDFSKEGTDVRGEIERICTRYCRIRSHGTALPVYGMAGAVLLLSVFVSPWWLVGSIGWAIFSMLYLVIIDGEREGGGIQKNAYFCNKWGKQVDYLIARRVIRKYQKSLPAQPEEKKEIAANTAHGSP